jgi:hypothetical protein
MLTDTNELFIVKRKRVLPPSVKNLPNLIVKGRRLLVLNETSVNTRQKPRLDDMLSLLTRRLLFGRHYSS